MTRTKATVLFSGGIDSTSCLYLLQKQGFKVQGLFVDFGQASAVMENRAVNEVAQELNVEVRHISVEAENDFKTGELVGRNAFLIFSAIMVGRCHDGILAMGIHAGTPYYDCSPHFAEKVGLLVEECTSGRVTLVAPFLHWQKDDVYSYFLSTELTLSKTYSCESGAFPPCGVCASCRDRVRLEC